MIIRKCDICNHKFNSSYKFESIYNREEVFEVCRICYYEWQKQKHLDMESYVKKIDKHFSKFVKKMKER